MSTSTTVDYKFGDDNNGSFHFPKITMCPVSFNEAFGDKLRQNCSDAQWGYLAIFPKLLFFLNELIIIHSKLKEEF